MINSITCSPAQIINSATARHLEVPKNVQEKAHLFERNGINIGMEEQDKEGRKSYNASLKFDDRDVFISQGPNLRKPTGFAGSAYYALKDLFSKIDEHSKFYTVDELELL